MKCRRETKGVDRKTFGLSIEAGRPLFDKI